MAVGIGLVRVNVGLGVLVITHFGYKPMFSGMILVEKISTIPETWACCPGIWTPIKKLICRKSALTIIYLICFFLVITSTK